MDITLASKWEQFITSQLQSGSYSNALDVIQEGLRLLQRETYLKEVCVPSQEDLELKLAATLKAVEAGRIVNGEDAFARLRQLSKAHSEDA